MMEDFLDDRFIIPEDIKKMTDEELNAEIERLEKEEKLKRDRKKNERICKKDVLDKHGE